MIQTMYVLTHNMVLKLLQTLPCSVFNINKNGNINVSVYIFSIFYYSLVYFIFSLF